MKQIAIITVIYAILIASLILTRATIQNYLLMLAGYLISLWIFVETDKISLS